MTVQHYNYNLLAVSVKAHSGVSFQTTEARRERTSTKIHVCVHTYTHTRTHHPLVHLQFMTLWKGEDFFFFQRATSVPWQTHKSFYFSATKQKSFLKPVRSLSLCSFGKSISCWNKPAVKFDKKSTFPECLCFAVVIRGTPWSFSYQSAALSIYVHPLGPASVDLSHVCGLQSSNQCLSVIVQSGKDPNGAGEMKQILASKSLQSTIC